MSHVETITFARFGVVRTLEVVGTCEESGSPLVELDGKLTGVSAIEVATAKAIDDDELTNVNPGIDWQTGAPITGKSTGFRIPPRPSQTSD